MSAISDNPWVRKINKDRSFGGAPPIVDEAGLRMLAESDIEAYRGMKVKKFHSDVLDTIRERYDGARKVLLSVGADVSRLPERLEIGSEEGAA